LRMEVWVRDYPKYKLGWAGSDFVVSWSLQDGRELSGEHFTTGESTHVEPQRWKQVVVAKEIGEKDRVEAVTICDPVDHRCAARVRLRD